MKNAICRKFCVGNVCSSIADKECGSALGKLTGEYKKSEAPFCSELRFSTSRQVSLGLFGLKLFHKLHVAFDLLSYLRR